MHPVARRLVRKKTRRRNKTNGKRLRLGLLRRFWQALMWVTLMSWLSICPNTPTTYHAPPSLPVRTQPTRASPSPYGGVAPPYPQGAEHYNINYDAAASAAAHTQLHNPSFAQTANAAEDYGYGVDWQKQGPDFKGWGKTLPVRGGLNVNWADAQDQEEAEWDDYYRWEKDERDNAVDETSDNQEMGQAEALEGMQPPSFEQLQAEAQAAQDSHNQKIEAANRAAQADRAQAAHDLR